MGKKQKTKNGFRKINPMMWIQKPALPSEKRVAGSVSPRKRFESTQPILRIYEACSAEMVRLSIAFSATEEARLMRLSNTPPMKETSNAFNGIGYAELTVDRNLEKGNPLSQLKDQI